MTVRSMSLFTALFVAACAGESPIDDDPRDAPTTTPDEVVDFAAHGAAPVGFAVLTDSDLTVKAWYPSTTTAPEDIEYYYCGPPMMNKCVQHMCEEFGVEPENISFDDFG